MLHGSHTLKECLFLNLDSLLATILQPLYYSHAPIFCVLYGMCLAGYFSVETLQLTQLM